MNSNTERWVDIDGYIGHYQVSNRGGWIYLEVCLIINKKRQNEFSGKRKSN